MVTGVEAAGLVLAILPLLISGLQQYQQGLIPIKDWLRYRSEVKSLIRNLNIEQVRFRMTCEKLLGGIVPEEELADLLQCPGGPAWYDEHIESRLKERLQESFAVYLATVEDMQDLLQSLRLKIGLDHEDKPAWICDEKASKREWKRIKISLARREHADLLRRMGKNNDDLDNLTRSSIDLESSRFSRYTGTESFKIVRDHAKSLYNVLALGMLCGCAVSHRANLRLDARGHRAKASRRGPKDVRFRVLFSSEINPMSSHLRWNWRDTEIQPSKNTNDEDCDSDVSDKALPVGRDAMGTLGKRHGSERGVLTLRPPKKGVQWVNDTHQRAQFPIRTLSNTNTNTGKIENLCHTFQQARETDCCLGFLADNQQRHHIYSISSPALACATQGTVSLHDLLSLSGRSPEVLGAVSDLELTSRDKLKLAWTLASTVLQLHSTPWLDPWWGTKDILFVPGTGAYLAEHSYISKSFSSIKMQRTVDLPEKPGRRNQFIQNEAVFALGIALLELSFGKTLRDLETSEDLDENQQRTIYTDALIAKRLANKVSLREGDRYGDAFRRCIDGLDVRNADLDSKDYRQAVYQNIVKPLEGIWNDFNKLE